MAVPQSLPDCRSGGESQSASVDVRLLEFAIQTNREEKWWIEGHPDLAGYEIISRLGSGSSGEVWLAEELETDRIVALKILHRHGAVGNLQEILQREIRMLATLVHPNLVLLYRAVTTADGRHGLAMEWIDGWPLDEWLELNPDLGLERKLQLFRDIVRGVAHLHDHGVIHRDLKPANLIVDKDGVVKIVDFGLARLYREDAATPSSGDSIGISGTLHFMAPEQAANSDGARATPVDVYALGLILYKLLTGQWLISAGGTPLETLAAVLSPPPLVLNGHARALPRDLQSILRQALAPDPAGRYRNARDLESDLERFSAKLPVAARKHTFVYLAATLLRRQARRSIVAGCLVLVGLGIGAATYYRHRKIAERNEANLRYAYALTSFTLGELLDELRAVTPGEASQPGGLPAADERASQALPLDAAGQLDLRYYEALLADLRSAASEGHARYDVALKSIQPALNRYSELASEAPNDPKRLLDAARARLSFARLLDRSGRTNAAGGEARKTLKQLDRLAAWPGFDQAPLPPLRCDVLFLLAKDAHEAGDPARACELTRETLGLAQTLPSGLLVRAENEVAPRLALAASDLVTYAIAAGPGQLSQAQQEIDRSTALCRAAFEGMPGSRPLIRGLALCLNAQARLSLQLGRKDGLPAIFKEGDSLLLREGSLVRLSSFPLITEFSATATAWAGLVLDDPDPELADAALDLARRFTNFLQANGAGSEEVMIQRGRLYLYESRLACRREGPAAGARAAARAVRILAPRQSHEPDQIPLGLLTAEALQQANALAKFPEAEWNPKKHRPQLDRILQKLAERRDELTPEQCRELSSLQ